MVSIALGSAVYIFSTSQGGDVHQLCDLGSKYITSVQWNKSGKYLAVGTSNAQVQVRKQASGWGSEGACRLVGGAVREHAG